MVPVIKHQGPDHTGPWDREDVFSSQREAPCLGQRRTIQPTKVFLGESDAGFVLRENMLERFRIRRIETGLRCVEFLQTGKARDVAWNARHVKRKLAERHGLVMRLP